MEQVAIAKKLANKHDIPFSRPSDYYAEMVKSDEHMERVRTKLVEESCVPAFESLSEGLAADTSSRQGIKKSEAAKKQRDLKKYGKQIQHEKIKQREMEKKSFTERMQGVKRSKFWHEVLERSLIPLPLRCRWSLSLNLTIADARQSGRRGPSWVTMMSSEYNWTRRWTIDLLVANLLAGVAEVGGEVVEGDAAGRINQG